MSNKPPNRKKIGCWQSGCVGGGVGGGCGCLIPIVLFIVYLITDSTGDVGGPLFVPISSFLVGCFGAIVGAVISLIAAFFINRGRKNDSDDETPPIAAP